MPLPVEAERDVTAIVLIGRFNPAIFQPMWFAANELMSKEDAEQAQINVIVPDLVQFTTRNLRLSVEREKFAVTCETIYRDIIHDLVLSCFGGILTHTPIRMMGVNRELHFKCHSEVERSEYGFKLAPPSAWGKWGDAIIAQAEECAKTEDRRHGGMMRVAMRETPRDDGRVGYFQAEVQPSGFIKEPIGIYVATNNHIELHPDTQDTAREMMSILDEIWEASAAKAEAVIADVMVQATGIKK